MCSGVDQCNRKQIGLVERLRKSSNWEQLIRDSEGNSSEDGIQTEVETHVSTDFEFEQMGLPSPVGDGKRSRVGAMNLRIVLGSEVGFLSQYMPEQDPTRTLS